MKVNDMFYFVSENHKFTEEFFYKNSGEFPVYSATIYAPVGYVNEYHMDVPCILVVNYGNAGKTRYIDDEKYNIGRNVCGLVLKEEFQEKILLEYARYILEKEFCVAVEEGNMGCLSQSALKDFDFPLELAQLPSIREQEEYISLMHRLLCRKLKIDEICQCIEEILDSKIRIPDDDLLQGRNVPVSEIFECMGGNSGLTEAFIYEHQNDEGIKCRVLSGATIESNELEMISENVFLKGKKLKFCNGEGVLVIRKGDAGNVRYLPNDNYTINDDAYILTVKDTCKYDICLKWFCIYYGRVFKEYASGNSNGTWNKTNFYSNTYINIPSYSFQKQVVKYYDYLNKIKNKCNQIQLEIKKIRNDI